MVTDSYTDDDLCTLYRNNPGKMEQIKILEDMSGKSHEELYDILTAHGYTDVPKPKVKRPLAVAKQVAIEAKKRAVEMRLQGYLVPDVAAATGLAETYIRTKWRRWAIEYGIKVPDARILGGVDMKAQVIEEKPEVVEEIVPAAPDGNTTAHLIRVMMAEINSLMETYDIRRVDLYLPGVSSKIKVTR